ncbi:MAG TPA: molybdopterin-dependent oxidoreductase [Leptolyngbyaceae cyanobacterium M33_DOE_097]|uniref:Oxidoreductase n=1 Tax=Oscillatoriales cyanobacterium SpSt-418 TaxID=2282169 RepID=A0A7C3KIP9_9CYAN|nr:molybdopterin-dependent oxidoreductase [Leptolyngbyaceae cyanobacterium M33_DOE_097]
MTAEPTPQPPIPDDEGLPRRSFLQIAGYTAFGWIAGATGLTLLESPLNKLFEPVNQKVEELIFRPQKLIPEFPKSAIEPDQLIVNSFRGNPVIDLANFRLEVTGEVEKPLSLSLDAVRQLPYKSMVIRHVCVEGWAAIVEWGGVRLSDILQMAQPKSGARYVYFDSADGYFSSWDLASATHPQTLLAYEKNGAPIPLENGAPLRLASPLKLGYKQSKWVTRILVTNDFLRAPQNQQLMRGYWEDFGYEWYAGL